MKRQILSTALLALLTFTSCNDDDDNSLDEPQQEEVATTTFRLTLRNAINYVNVKRIGEAPLTTTGQVFETKFKATSGTYLSFANMFAQSNDWFFGTDSQGIKLWDGDTPKTGDISSYVNVYDAGTEIDEDFLTDFGNTIYTAPRQNEPNSGPADDNNIVRDTGRDILNYLSADLSYDANDREFTLIITKANREALPNLGFVTPGILVVHTLDNAIYEVGEPIKANGFEGLAEDGSPMAIYEWFNEKGSTDAPLRLSSSMSVLSPAVAYVHDGDQTPLFTRGETIITDNGLEELAEDGDPQLAFEYLEGMDNVKAYMSNAGAAPNEVITFDVEARPGQRLNFATMLVSSNDWFISNNQAGIELFNEDGSAKSTFDISKNYLYDSGTETDQEVGLGNGQPMLGNTDVADDTDTTVRRVTEISDIQFGKGIINSGAGVTQHRESRGGYNLIEVIVERIN